MRQKSCFCGIYTPARATTGHILDQFRGLLYLFRSVIIANLCFFKFCFKYKDFVCVYEIIALKKKPASPPRILNCSSTHVVSRLVQFYQFFISIFFIIPFYLSLILELSNRLVYDSLK